MLHVLASFLWGSVNLSGNPTLAAKHPPARCGKIEVAIKVDKAGCLQTLHLWVSRLRPTLAGKRALGRDSTSENTVQRCVCPTVRSDEDLFHILLLSISGVPILTPNRHTEGNRLLEVTTKKIEGAAAREAQKDRPAVSNLKIVEQGHFGS